MLLRGAVPGYFVSKNHVILLDEGLSYPLYNYGIMDHFMPFISLNFISAWHQELLHVKVIRITGNGLDSLGLMLSARTRSAFFKIKWPSGARIDA